MASIIQENTLSLKEVASIGEGNEEYRFVIYTFLFRRRDFTTPVILNNLLRSIEFNMVSMSKLISFVGFDFIH